MLKPLFFVLLALSTQCQAQHTLTDLNTSYFQDFDGLDSFGTALANVPSGWSFHEWGSAANTTYRAGAGSATTSDTYSFGPLRSRDRALGSLASGTLTKVVYGTMFVNHTGGDINAFRLAYRGEQWRRGGSGSADSLRFYFTTVSGSRLSDSSMVSWSEVPALCFTSVSTLNSSGALNGNDSCRRLYATVPLMLHHGDTLLIRWCDLNAAGSDDGLAIDSVSIAFQNGVVLAGSHPGLVSFSPDSSATGLRPDLNLVLRFDRAVRTGGGSLFLRNLTTVKTDTIAANRGQIRSAGREVIFSGMQFTEGEAYEVQFDSSAFDSSGFLSAGLQDSRWRFRITKLALEPVDEAIPVSIYAMTGGRLLIRSAPGFSDSFSLRIYDLDGRLQFHRVQQVSQRNIVVDPQLPARGCYLVIMQNQERRLSTKICRLE